MYEIYTYFKKNTKKTFVFFQIMSTKLRVTMGLLKKHGYGIIKLQYQYSNERLCYVNTYKTYCYLY